eukprot:11062405-Alexandrium_andersonii.AAC.1
MDQRAMRLEAGGGVQNAKVVALHCKRAVVGPRAGRCECLEGQEPRDPLPRRLEGRVAGDGVEA